MGHLSLSVLIKCAFIKKKCTEKQRTVNHMIIFNDSIGKFYQCSIFVEAYLCFLVSASAKEMPRTKFLDLKNNVPRIKYICLKKKSNVSNISNIFKLDFITQIIYRIIHRCLYSLFRPFCSLISVSKKQNIEQVLALPCS